MKPLHQSTSKIVSQNCSRKFVAIGKVVKVWPEIIGEELARFATPVKIHYQKPKSRKDNPKAVLYIETNSAHATILHYQKAIILEKISHYFGAGWIEDLKIKANAGPLTEKPIKRAPAPLTEEEKNHLSELLDPFDDQEMAARLRQLGQGIMRR